MSKTNSALIRAQKTINDEYYTQYSDIEKEISSYPPSVFRNKVIYCSADNKTSNFYRYFKTNFDRLGLKRLICTSIDKSYCEIDCDGERERERSLISGDFRSPECIKILDNCDIVITNPPFSLFNEYIQILLAHKKKFMLVGPQYTITYSKLYPLFCKRLLNFGNTALRSFISPTNELKPFGSTYWITNLKILPKKPIKFTKSYNPLDYPLIDEYDAIFVKKTQDIPIGYSGWMAVPETIFLKDTTPFEFGPILYDPHVNGIPKYRRIAVRFKH